MHTHSDQGYNLLICINFFLRRKCCCIISPRPMSISMILGSIMSGTKSGRGLGLYKVLTGSRDLPSESLHICLDIIR